MATQRLNKKRNDFIAKKQSEDERNLARDGFDIRVLQILRRQATRNGTIEYGVDEKKK